MTTLTGFQLPQVLEPGSPEWQRKMSASKVGAVMGTSIHESWFSLWHRMAGNAPGQVLNDEMMLGHYMEPMISKWFADQHPEFTLVAGGTWQHSEREWQIASPDRGVLTPEAGWEQPADDGAIDAPVMDLTTFLECKFSQYEDDWTDDHIPAGYYDQVQWQIDTTGVKGVWVAVYIGIAMSFREYWIPRNQQRIERLRNRASEFMETLPTGSNPTPPDVDAHTETYVVVRAMNPDIDGDVTLDEDEVALFRDAKAATKLAKEHEQLAVNTIATRMGNARRALAPDGTVVCSRQKGRNGAPPFLKAAPQKRTAPTVKAA